MKKIRHTGGVDNHSLVALASKAFQSAFMLTTEGEPQVFRSDLETRILLPNEESRPGSEVRVMTLANHGATSLQALITIIGGEDLDEDWIPYTILVWGQGGGRYERCEFRVSP